jgi:hypothetical protein
MARRAGAVVGALLLVVAAGCGREAEPSSVPSPTPGPAEAYLEAALGFSSDEAAGAALRQEEIIASCMAEQGFEYIPDTSGYTYIDTTEIDPPPGTREFAEQFGYGFVALPEGMRSEYAGPAAPTPKDEIMGAMSPEELTAYTRALWGDEVADGGASDGGIELGGCERRARDEVWGDRDTDHVRAGLEDEIARIDAEVAPMDPAVAHVAARWSECMSDAGHPGYAGPADAEQAAWDQWMALNDAIDVDPTLGLVASDGLVVGEADLAAREAALATADWDCRAATDYDTVWQAARHRLQQDYVDAHRSELDAWVETSS